MIRKGIRETTRTLTVSRPTSGRSPVIITP
jgi:hypothetical protein